VSQKCPESQIRSRQDHGDDGAEEHHHAEGAASDAASFGQSQPVTDTTHGVDQFRSAILVNLLAQAIYVDFHQVGFAIEVAVPHMFDNFTSRNQFRSVKQK